MKISIILRASFQFMTIRIQCCQKSEILYNFITNKNSDLAKIDILHYVISSALFSCPPSERRALLASQTSLTPLGKNGHNIPATLALESKELVKSVRAILDMDCKFSIRFHSFNNHLFSKTKENFTFDHLLL